MAAPRILVDGYNLALKQGTGVKTYTMLLDKALRSLGADTHFLFGKQLTDNSDPLLTEVLFYDTVARDKTSLNATLRRLSYAAGAAMNRSPNVFRVPDAGVVTLPDEDRLGARALNGSRVFDIGSLRSLLLGKPLDVRTPERFDAFHMTFPLPVRVKEASKTIVTIHDLIPLRLPFTTLDNKAELLRRHRSLVKDCDLIFTVSEHSKADIVELLQVDPDKIAVTYQPSRFEPLHESEAAERAKVLSRFELTAKDYVLFVGALEPKKNIGRLARAYMEADVRQPLVMVGPRGWLWAEELSGVLKDEKDPADRKIIFLDHIQAADLRYLYSGALAVTFPSLYEGYGLPVVEAMAMGAPVLTSRSSCLPEVCGEAALYVDPYDVRDIREKIERLVSDKSLRDHLAAKGSERAAALSPAAFREQVADGYRRIGLLE